MGGGLLQLLSCVVFCCALLQLLCCVVGGGLLQVLCGVGVWCGAAGAVLCGVLSGAVLCGLAPRCVCRTDGVCGALQAA